LKIVIIYKESIFIDKKVTYYTMKYKGLQM